MISNNVFNVSSIRRQAVEYRINLKNSINPEEILKLESLLNSLTDPFQSLSFYTPTLFSTIDGIDVNNSLKLFFTYFMYSSLFFQNFDRMKSSFDNKTKNYLKLLNKDLKILNAETIASQIKLNSKYNKVKLYNVFQEKDFYESYDLLDKKTSYSFNKDRQADFKADGISAKLLKDEEVFLTSIEIIEEESFGGDNLNQIKVDSDTSLIFRDNKFFNYIVGKNITNEIGLRTENKEIALTLVLNFNGEQDLNNLYIKSASSLPISFNLNNFYKWEDDSWILIEGCKEFETYDRKQIFFSRIRTKKIKIKLTQNKYIDAAFVKDQKEEDAIQEIFFKRSFLNFSPIINKKKIQNIYDLSLSDIIPRLKTYTGFGFYREGNPVAVNSPLSFNIDYNLLFQDEDTFIEKEAHVILYGEKDFYAYKKGLREKFLGTKRCNQIIPIPSKTNYEKEILIFNSNKEAYLKLYPLLSNKSLQLNDIVFIKRNNVLLRLGIDYQISFDGGNLFYTDENTFVNSINLKTKDKIAGDVIVRLLNNSINYGNVYTVEYKLENNFYLTEDKLISSINKEIVFDSNLNDSVGFIRPRFIFRNFSKNNESSIIQDYRVLIEELNENKDFYIEYEDILEIISRSGSNVI